MSKRLPDTRMHGTRSMFVAGCGCAKCRQANRDYMRELMRTRRARERRRALLDQRERELDELLGGDGAA